MCRGLLCALISVTDECCENTRAEPIAVQMWAQLFLLLLLNYICYLNCTFLERQFLEVLLNVFSITSHPIFTNIGPNSFKIPFVAVDRHPVDSLASVLVSVLIHLFIIVLIILAGQRRLEITALNGQLCVRSVFGEKL